MARGINKVILVGNVGNDPDMRFLPNGNPVINFSIATSESWKDKQTGEKQERTEWHRIVIFNRLAEIAGEYLRKGSKVYIEGSLRTRKWQDQSGADKYMTEIIASEMQMLDSRNSNASEGFSPSNMNTQQNYQSNPQASGQQPSQPYQAPAQQPYQQQAAQQQSNQGFSASQAAAPAPVAMDNFDDDVPF